MMSKMSTGKQVTRKDNNAQVMARAAELKQMAKKISNQKAGEAEKSEYDSLYQDLKKFSKKN